MQDWYKYFATVLNEERSEYTEEEENLEPMDFKMQISEEEIYNIILKMKSGKSPGPGNVNQELIKYGGRKLLQ